MSEIYEMAGTVAVVMDKQTFASGFEKREFVVDDDDDKYPQFIKFEVIKERCALLDDASEGDKVSVRFRIRGNEYKGKYYNNLAAFEVAVEKAQPAPMPADATPTDQATIDQCSADMDLPVDESLPF